MTTVTGISWLADWMDAFRTRSALPAFHVHEDLADTSARTMNQQPPESSGTGAPSGCDRNVPSEKGPHLVVLPGALPLPGLGELLDTLDTAAPTTFAFTDGATGHTLALLSCCTVKTDQVLAALGKDLANSESHIPDVGGVLTSFQCNCRDLQTEVVPLDSNDVLGNASMDAQHLFASDDTWHEAEASMRERVFLAFDPQSLTDVHRHMPLDFYLNEASPIGAYSRLLRKSSEPSGHINNERHPGFTFADVDIVAVTLNRWRCVQELLHSIRRNFGYEPTITVVAQNRSSLRWSFLARRYQTTFLFVDNDLGLSASRNLAVASTSRPLVWLMDDDFQIDERCRATDALQIMSENASIDVLGGNLLDVPRHSAPRSEEQSQGFAMKATRKPKSVTWTRLEDLPRERDYLDSCTYLEYCDIVDNFALFRRETTFDTGVTWDPHLKINAEHQDLYLKFLDLGNITVARTNALKVRNIRIQSKAFRSKRNRQDQFFSHFFRSHRLDSFAITGGWSRVMCTNGRNAAKALNSPWGHKPEFTISRESF